MKIKMMIASLLAATFFAKAQIPNSSFENLTTDGKIKNWGLVFFTLVQIDSMGVAHTDSIVFDQDLYFSTSDAHTSSRALEMRNAFDYTSNAGIAGGARLMSNDSDYAAFAPMQVISQRPVSFNFYYKFLPAAADTAIAYLNLFDSLGNEIGNCTIEVSATSPNYTLATQPIIYSDPLAQAAGVTITFSTAKPGTSPNFGTRFLVDDVSLDNTATAIPSQSFQKNGLSFFPNPVQDQITINLNGALKGSDKNLEIYDAAGKMVKHASYSSSDTQVQLDVTQLAKGMYTLSITGGEKKYSATFIK